MNNWLDNEFVDSFVENAIISRPITNRLFTELNPLVTGCQKCMPETAFGPYIRDFYLIHYIVSGKGMFVNENGIHHLDAGKYFLIRPGEKTFYKADKNAPWVYTWLGFDGSLASQFDSVPDVGDFPEPTVFLDVIDAMEIDSKFEEYLTSKLFMIYYLLLRDKKEPSTYIKKAKNYIQRNYMLELDVEDVAKVLGVNRIYLSRSFKEQYGVSLKSYIIQVRMNYAKTFLENGYSVSETAEMVGYTDAFGFSRMFKKYFGISPAEIKKRVVKPMKI